MKNKNPAKELFSYRKILLLAALVCEVIAYLIRIGKLAWNPELVSRLTLAGGILILIYLVWAGLSGKVDYYREKWGFDNKNVKQ